MSQDDPKVVDMSALAPDKIVDKAVDVGVSKSSMATGRCFVSAMLAGAFIGFGAMFFCTFLGDSNIPFAAQRIVGGICFCLGLILVLCCGAELFTGNILLVCAKSEKKISWAQLFKNWCVVWLGNLVGALIAVAIVYFSSLQTMNSGMVGDAFVSLAAGKITLSPITLVAKAIMCNILVCLAVWIGFAGKTIVDKVIGLIFPIAAFVACGFEHCVANMFFLPMGFILNTQGFGSNFSIGVEGIIYNLVLATIGNIIGGAIVGIAYWFIYRKKKA